MLDIFLHKIQIQKSIFPYFYLHLENGEELIISSFDDPYPKAYFRVRLRNATK